MGFAIYEMSCEDLNEILDEVDFQNDRNFTTFKNALHQMYGGVCIPIFELLFDFLNKELLITSDSDLENITEREKDSIIAFLSREAS